MLTRSDGVIRCSALQQLRRALLHDHMGHLLATADPAWCVTFPYPANTTINTPYQQHYQHKLLI